MRSSSSINSVNETLTLEAGAVLKHAVAEACRRGHGQATPLHVASAILSIPGSPLRRVCLQSDATLQCRGLEVCFNIALDRVPAGPPSLGGGVPSYSNALVAALKRAQAQQRRGCPDHQPHHQQLPPLLAIKVELPQLLISVLDDPSVSRVMAEAGFSSIDIRRRIEESTVVLTTPPSPGGTFFRLGIPQRSPPFIVPNQNPNPNPFRPFQHSPRAYSNPRLLPSPTPSTEETRRIIDVLLRWKRRNPLLIGESGLSTQSTLSQLMYQIEKGDAPIELRQVRSFPIHFSSHLLSAATKEDVDKHFQDLHKLVSGFMPGGAIIHIGDLQWLLDRKRAASSPFCPIQYAYKEMGRLLLHFTSTNRLWLICTASCDTYIKCQTNYPALESEWELQPIPVNSLSPALGLALHNRLQSQETENISFSPLVSSIPPSQSEKPNRCSDVRLSLSLKDHEKNTHSESSCSCSSSVEAPNGDKFMGRTPTELSRTHSGFPPWLLNALPLNTSKSQQNTEGAGQFRSMDPDTFKCLYNGLVERVGWQKQVISPIVNAVVECRSGLRKIHKGCDTWLLFLGPDRMGKRRMAESLVELIFGTNKNLICLSLGSSPVLPQSIWTSDSDPSLVVSRGKMPLDRFSEVVKLNPFSVVLLEDVDEADVQTKRQLKYAMEKGRLQESNGGEVSLGNVIVVLTSSIGSPLSPPNQFKGWLELSEEKLLAIPRMGMQLTIEERRCEKVLLQVNSKVAVVDYSSMHSSMLHQLSEVKRKAEWIAEGYESKRMMLSLDLNLSAEENELCNSTIRLEACKYSNNNNNNNNNNRQDSDSDSSIETQACKRLEGFRELVDALVVFQPYNFENLLYNVVSSLGGAFLKRIPLDSCFFEIDVKILECILAAAWWSSGSRKESIECWVENILETSFSTIFDKHNLFAPGIVIKFLPQLNTSDDEYQPSTLCLPTNISIEVANDIT